MSSRLKTVVVAGLLAMIAVHVALFWMLRRQILEGYSDFAILYTAGQIVRTGLGHRLYDEQTQWKVQQSFSPKVTIRHGPLPYNHAAYEAWIFAPLSTFSYSTAYVIWTAINVLMLLIVVGLMRKYWPAGQRFPFTLLLFLAFFPVFVALLQGQDSILLLLLYAVSFECIRSERGFVAGVLLGLGCFKPHLILPVLAILAFQKQIKILAGFVLCAILVFFACAATVGWHNALSYPRYVWTLNQHPEIGAIKPQLMPNLRGLIDGFLHTRLPSVLLSVVIFAISAVLVLVAAEAWRRSKIDAKSRCDEVDALGFSLAILTTVVVSYHLYAYDATLLLIPVLVVTKIVAEDQRIPRHTRTTVIFLTATLLFTPLWALLLFKVGYLNLMCLPLLVFGYAIVSIMFAQTGHTSTSTTSLARL